MSLRVKPLGSLVAEQINAAIPDKREAKFFSKMGQGDRQGFEAEIDETIQSDFAFDEQGRFGLAVDVPDEIAVPVEANFGKSSGKQANGVLNARIKVKVWWREGTANG